MEHLISAYIEERVSEIIIPSAGILVDVLHKDSLTSIDKKQTTLLDPKTKIKMIYPKIGRRRHFIGSFSRLKSNVFDD